MQQQQQQHQRNVDNMLPIRTKKKQATHTTTSLSMLIITATTLLLATFDISTAAAAAASKTAAITQETPVAAAVTTNVAKPHQVIGAKSLAAAAAAAEAVSTAAIAASFSATRSGSSSSSDEIPITAQSSANLLLEDMQHPGNMVNLTRHHDGDVFRTTGVTHCNADTCVGLSSGTAGLVQMGGNNHDISSRTSAVSSLAGGGAVGHSDGRMGAKRGKLPVINDVGSSCDCLCLPYLSTYREDLGICVDDIHECTLSPFVSGSSSEKIPFVFLPLRGQIIYPSREISFPDIRTPVCAVTGAQYLTTNGWTDLRNPIDTDYPFRMFRDEGRTFLQWLGEPELRQKMQGRLIVVHLVCRDMMLTLNATKDLFKSKPPKNVFSPCVAFRVNGSPVKYFHNVSEVLFQAETTSTLAATSDGMSTKEYVVIGVCSLLLGLIYVSSVFLYLHMKKRKTRDQSHVRNSLDDLANEINYPKNDQVTFGAPFNRSGSIYSGTSLATTSNEPRSRASISSAVGVHLKGEEMGIVKSNPLLQHFPQLSELHSGFSSDISNSNSECEMDGNGGSSGYNEKLKQLQTSALVHPAGTAHNPASMGQNNALGNGSDTTREMAESAQQEQECLPVENVSIVEDMMSEEKLEQMRAMINGTVRKKLYFNPAYFEPHLLAQPPPAAIEFLTKIREVIAIAKYKMATKRYQPSLIVIPEEGPMRSTTPSLYSSQLQLSGGTDGCRGCATNRCSGHIKNCGDKRNSIEKWLQSVPLSDANKSENQSSTGETQQNGEKSRERSTQEYAGTRDKSPANQQQQQQQRRHNALPAPTTAHNKTSPPRKEISPPKQRPPPPPTPTSQSNSSQSKSAASTPRSQVIEIRHDTPPYEVHKTPKHGSSATTVTVNRSFDAISAALSSATNIYGFAEMGGEIYNNPKFSLHDSPSASQRSRSSSHRSKSSRKRLDVLEQYTAASTPTSLNSADREHYEMLRDMKKMPDMVYDVIARDYNAALVGTNGNYHLDIPTPDYDSTLEKKIKDIYYNTALSSTPSVPTPDYSTLSKKSLRQCQPDSPIYRRKSPQYLIVDYETDSLERLAASKRKSSQSSSSPSSDVSSQLSPSLSTALPLEEELEISHTVYDKVNGFRKEGNVKKKITTKTENTIAKQKEIETRIKYDTPFHGSMTIEVEHEPPSDMELSTDSDQYEPDTLDRKPKKHSFCDVNSWSEHMQKAKNFVNEQGDCDEKSAISYHHLENMNSLPELKTIQPLDKRSTQTFVLCPSSSFRNEVLSHGQRTSLQCSAGSSASEHEQVSRRPSFESLREIYQSKLMRQHSQSSQGSHGSQRSYIQQQAAKVSVPAAETRTLVDKAGRLLTLEAKHSRRQRLMEQKLPPPEIETEVVENKTTIKIRTPTMNRPVLTSANRSIATSGSIAEVHNVSSSPTNSSSTAASTKQSDGKPVSKGFYELTKNFSGWNSKQNEVGRGMQQQKKRPSPASPPPAPPPTSASTTLTSQRSMRSELSERSECTNASSNYQLQRPGHFYQNQTQYLNQLTINSNGTSNATEEETASNHSESTEVTGVSDTQANSDFGGSCNNTLNSDMQKACAVEAPIVTTDSISLKVVAEDECNHKSRRNSISSNHYETPAKSLHDSPQVIKKLQEKEHVVDYRAYTPTPYNGLRNDYSLNKYLNRRKSQDHSGDEDTTSRDSCTETSSQLEANNNTKNVVDTNDSTKLFDRVDVISLSSRSNRSSSRLSDRTKEMYRNAGVPVGIAYPQRSTANNNNSNSSTAAATTNVQTVYRCEIEPVQLTHGMQIAMGLKDRAKKAKDLKNAWKKFVSMAAAKFSPTASPAPPFEKKTAASFLEALERDEGISSLIDGHPQVSTPKSSYSAPASQNYYEQRFGTARLQEMDSGYMSADSGEVYKRSFYDRYNFRMMSGRDRVIRVDTIEDNSDGGSTLTEPQPEGSGSRRASIVDSNRFEDFEHMSEPPETADSEVEQRCDDCSDADSDKTLTRSNGQRIVGGTPNIYSSEDERGNSGASCGSSETDGEPNVEDMWESGAESIETHSVLYKNVRKK